MNETSSRSHAVFTLFLSSNRFDETANLNTEKASRISLVDLAGSERANSTGATGVRLKEGANINKSLTTLGKVIAALAESSTSKKSSALNPNFVPYRDSVLTWLLKDSLGGNSKTAMIAAISPADYDETMSTLRYADQAKRIKNKAVVNEDPNARLIRELKEELQALRDTLMIYAPEEVEKIIQQKKYKAGSSRASSRASAIAARATSTSPMLLISPESPIATQRGNSLLTKEQVIDQLQSSEKLLSQVNQTWEEKMNKTEEIHRQREKALEELGVIVEKDNMVGVYAPKTIHLINLNEDPLMTECLMYQIKSGITRVGRLGSQVPADIRLSGNEILDEHCYFENNPVPESEEEENRIVTICPGKDSVTLVNGMRILQPKVLHSGYRIIFGSGLHHLFRFNNPDEVRREREQMQQRQLLQQQLSTSPSDDIALGSIISPASTTVDVVDWKYAHSEAVRKYGVTNNATDLAVMTDEDLKQLSDGITKVREFRNRKRISSDSHHHLFSNYENSSINDDVSPRTSISSSSNKRFSAISSAPTLLSEDGGEEEFLKVSTANNKEENERLSRVATEEMQLKLELQKQEYEEKLKLVESSNMKADELNRERDDLAAKYTQIKEEMENTLEQQKMAYESKIKRISAHLPPGTALSSDNLLIGYTAKNAAEHLLRQAVKKWRGLKYVKMAEDCLIHAVVLKEANIMAKELGKNVVYQFIVVHDDISSNPSSFWESTSALQPFTREPDTHLSKEAKPCVAVQVIDHVHRANYIWSITKLKHRLRRMRRLYDYTDRPLFTGQHFNREDPFYETPCPRFSLIGLARVPLRNLTLQLHADNYVDVYCRNTGKIMGQIRVLITPIARSVSRKHQQQRPALNTRQNSSSNSLMEQQGEKYLLHIGQQQVFEIRIQELKGVEESDFTQVHAQFRLSSFGNVERYSAADKIYQTDPISSFDGGHIVFNQCQTLSINITENMMDVILNQGLTIEVYGQAQENYLYGLVEHVSSNNSSSPTTPSSTITNTTTTEPTSLFVTKATSTTENFVPASRRFSIDQRFSLEKSTYDGILMEERHDVLTWVQICELDANGQYVPVQVTHSYENKQHQDIFCLRQGLQRRIAFTLSHDSGKQFEWLDIKNAKIGNVRLVDNKGRITESLPHDPVAIQLFTTQQQVVFERNGTSRLGAQGPWDSSLHDSLFLNRVTSSGQRIRLTLSWQISCDKCVTPLCFDMDISVQIGTMMHTSSSSSSMFRSLLGGGGQSSGSASSSGNKSSGMFIVNLKPPMTRQVRELWRLNTANKYVRGEEFIGSWKPRGVSLITDYRTARHRMLQRESVAAFRHALVLAGHPQTKIIQRSQSGHMLTIGQFAQNGGGNEEEEEDGYTAAEKKIEKDPQALTRKVIDLWNSQFGTREEVILLIAWYHKKCIFNKQFYCSSL
jgi:kinesin family protein 1